MRDVRMGRGVFLGVVGAGVAGLFVGGRVSHLASPLGAVVPNALRSLVPNGWRIYSVNPPWPTFDPATYRLQVTGAVEHPLSLSWTRCWRCPRLARRPTFTASPDGRLAVCTGRACGCRSCGTGQADVRGEVRQLRLA